MWISDAFFLFFFEKLSYIKFQNTKKMWMDARTSPHPVLDIFKKQEKAAKT